LHKRTHVNKSVARTCKSNLLLRKKIHTV